MAITYKDFDENETKLREQNIRWTISENYEHDLSFFLYPIFKRYSLDIEENDESKIYFNSMLGILDRCFDLKLVIAFMHKVNNEISQGSELIKLMAIPLEKAASNLLISERPVFLEIRRTFFKKLLPYFERFSKDNGFAIIDRGYVERSLGMVPKIDGMSKNLLNDLEELAKSDTNGLITGMKDILKFHFVLIENHKSSKMDKKNKDNPVENKKNDKRVELLSDEDLLKELTIGSAEFMDNILLDESKKSFKKEESIGKNKLLSADDRREFIEKNYGPSMILPKEISALEKEISLGIHSKQKIHISKGFSINPEDVKKAIEILTGNRSLANDSIYWLTDRSQALEQELPQLPYRQRLMRRARIDNELYIRENMRSVKRAISILTSKLKFALRDQAEEGLFYHDHGLLKSDLAWKNPILHERKVFLKNSNEDKSQLLVDLVLDSSASQEDQKESVACQAYILSKALENAKIPLRVSSFQSQQGFTIIRQFRDYYETNKSREVLNYFPDAANRDGYAFDIVRTRMLKKNHHKNVMIVLSDGKPYDARIGINTHSFDKQKEYKDKIAIIDASQKVRKIRQDNIPLFGIFTGKEEDLAAALKIYGHGFAYIKKVERFAELVSELLIKEIKESSI